MKFSVVIPLFNKEYSILRCIDSILAQNLPADEIVIVDDGSTDLSSAIVKKSYTDLISKGYIKYIEQPNQGVSVARNNGVLASNSEYVCFIDADDEWAPNFINEMNYLINNYPDAVLYSVAYFKKYGSMKAIKSKRGLPNGYIGYVDDFFKSSSIGNVVCASTACVAKSEFLKVGGFPKDVVRGEDLFVWIQLALNGKVACSEKFLCTVHIQKDSSRMSRTNSIPYPIEYYSKNTHLLTNNYLKKYLFLIFYKHFLQSIIDLNFKEAYLRLKMYLKILKI